jgi:molybdopterin-guanine dinucleotide biosynthesis protein A
MAGTAVKEMHQSQKKKPYEHITGVILAGGLSTRYGKNKAFLEIEGARLIDRIAEKMQNIFTRVLLVTNEKQDYGYLGLPLIEDRIKGLGPIGGIYTGLMSISGEGGFFVACDMPFLNEQLVRYMVEVQDHHAAVVPCVGNEIEPLHALYTTTCLGPIRRLIESRQYQVRLFYQSVSVRYVTENEIRRFAQPRNAFHNINTPEEFAAVQRHRKRGN